jgi:hypothetical protein
VKKRSAKSVILKNLSDVPGWRTREKLIVFESDDWGSIRMPSKEVFNNLQQNGMDLLSDEGSLYNKNDSLARSEDLASLFEVLTTVKDSTGRPAVFTPMAVVANPDFNRIRQSGFNTYYYEPFTVTLKTYPGCESSFELWKAGMENRLFVPQFHGREHLNVKAWMRALQQGHSKVHRAFDNGMWGISTAEDPVIGLELQAAFDFNDPMDLPYHQEVLKTGLDLFEELFGYRACYFVPANGIYSSTLEPACSAEGIRHLFVSKLQKEPLGNGRQRNRLHWLGQKNRTGITFLTRNCFFEPVQPGRDWVDSCLFDISTAFRWHKPALISSHRVNYIGALSKQNRENGLKQLELLLKEIINTWPAARFITSAELGEIIENA